MIDWRIYYHDGSTFSSVEGDPSVARADGIEVIVQADPCVGRSIIEGKDFYIFDGEKWVGMDDDGVKTHLRLCGVLKQGLTVSREHFDTIYQRALADTDFPRKSARYADELPLD